MRLRVNFLSCWGGKVLFFGGCYSFVWLWVFLFVLMILCVMWLRIVDVVDGLVIVLLFGAHCGWFLSFLI